MDRRLVVVVALALPVPGWAFCNEFSIIGVPVHCEGQGHGTLTQTLSFFLRGPVVDRMEEKNHDEDQGSAEHAFDRHHDSCLFEESGEYIRYRYDLAVAELDPAEPNPYEAATHFGLLLHGVQDLYSHSNWVELLEEDYGPWGGIDSANLLEPTTGRWSLEPMDFVYGNIRVGQVPAGGLPAGWVPALGETSAIPTITTPEGVVYRALTTHWNSDTRSGPA